MGSKMKQDKGRGSERPPAETHRPAMRVGKWVCGISTAGITLGVYGIFNEQTISISVFAHQMITF